MRVIKKARLEAFWKLHHSTESALEAWYRMARRASWMTFADVRADCPSADRVGKHVVFNVGGNKVRLITAIHFNTRKVFIRFVLTHKEYDDGRWKSD